MRLGQQAPGCGIARVVHEPSAQVANGLRRLGRTNQRQRAQQYLGAGGHRAGGCRCSQQSAGTRRIARRQRQFRAQPARLLPGRRVVAATLIQPGVQSNGQRPITQLHGGQGGTVQNPRLLRV